MMETIKTTIYLFHGLAAFHIQRQVIIKLTLLALQNTVLISQILFLSTLAFELEYAAVFVKTRNLILAGKGFVIHDLLPKNIFLNLPAFLHGKHQFTREVVVYSWGVSSCSTGADPRGQGPWSLQMAMFPIASKC